MDELSNTQTADILVEMTEQQLPTISPIKSPAKRSAILIDSEGEIPSSQPPAKRQKTTDHKPDLNRLTYLQTRKAKATKSLSYLKEYHTKGTCPVGLQYRPKPHLRQTKDFQKAMHQICLEAEQKLLALMISQQELNIKEDSQSIDNLKSHLTNNQYSNKAVKSAISRTQSRTNKKPKPDTVKMADLHAKFNELKAMLETMNT